MAMSNREDDPGRVADPEAIARRLAERLHPQRSSRAHVGLRLTAAAGANYEAFAKLGEYSYDGEYSSSADTAFLAWEGLVRVLWRELAVRAAEDAQVLEVARRALEDYALHPGRYEDGSREGG